MTLDSNGVMEENTPNDIWFSDRSTNLLLAKNQSNIGHDLREDR